MLTMFSYKTRECIIHKVMRDGETIGFVREIFRDVFYRDGCATRYTSLDDAIASFT
jgi:hypothetical protein